MTDAMQLELALDAVHAALLAGSFEKLPKIVLETEGLLMRIQSLPDRASAERLRHKANRNSQCLQAAARGLRAAERRLLETAGTTKSLSTYTSQGQRSDLGIGPATLTQRL